MAENGEKKNEGGKKSRPNLIRPFVRAMGLVVLFSGVAVLKSQWPDLYHKYLGPLQSAEFGMRDFFYRAREVPKVDERLAVIDIDEKTIEEIGRWPFARSESARLLESLRRQGAEIIASNIVFADRSSSDTGWVSKLLDNSRTSTDAAELSKRIERLTRANDDPATRKALREAEKIIQRHQSLTDGLRQRLAVDLGDQKIAEEVEKNGSALLGLWFYGTQDETSGISKEKKEASDKILTRYRLRNVHYEDGVSYQSISDRFSDVFGAMVNLPLISDAGGKAGYVNFFGDPDGVMRRARLAVVYNGEFYPSLTLLSAAENARLAGGEGRIDLYLDGRGVRSITVDDQPIVVDANGDMVINYLGGPDSVPHYSWTDAVNSRLPYGALDQKILFVGSSALGYGDFHLSPEGEEISEVELYAHALNTITSRAYILDSFPNQAWYEWGLLFVTGLLVSLLFYKRSIAEAIGASAAFLFLLPVATYAGLAYWNSMLDVTLPIIQIVLINILFIAYRFYMESDEKKFIKGAFSQYLSPTVIDQLVNDPDKLNLGGQEKVCTAFFSDVAGFSTISEQLSPPDLVHLLNEYLTEMTQIILDVEGTVDKYEGDAVIAFFGAPLDYEDHATRACIASIRQQRRLGELRQKWRSEGNPELFVRIGLNTGRMLIGNMGSNMRMDYTMMGDSVNLAARLEGANKPYNTSILVSETTYKAAKNSVEGREIDKIRVVGKRQPVTVFEILEEKGKLSSQTAELLGPYREGLKLYQARKFPNALGYFNEALKIAPNDGPSLTYRKRCEAFISEPPSDEWDGVFEMTSK